MSGDTQSKISRRRFVHRAGVMAGATALGNAVDPLSSVAAQKRGELALRVLGRTKLRVTCMTLGAAPCGIASDVSVDEVAQIVNLAIDSGINFIDTALKYGKSEEGVGQALGQRRKDIYLATANLGVHTAEQVRQNVEIVKRFRPLSSEEQEKATALGKKMAVDWGPHFGPVS